MNVRRVLAVASIFIAGIVLLTSVAPYANIIPRRSIWSILVGAILVIGSLIELLLVPFFVHQFIKSPSFCSRVSLFALGAASVAAVPFVVMLAKVIAP
jgi:hypothetical protein